MTSATSEPTINAAAVVKETLLMADCLSAASMLESKSRRAAPSAEVFILAQLDPYKQQGRGIVLTQRSALSEESGAIEPVRLWGDHDPRRK